MSAIRFSTYFVSAAVIAGLVAGCGGSAGTSTASTTTSTGTATSASGAAPPSAQITRSWSQFFNASTSSSERVSLLQNGSKYKSLVVAQSKSPLAQQSSVKVSNVTITGPKTATVKYTILVAGKPALKNQTGKAVKSAGTWKVGDASFCRLVGLQGRTPSICSTA